MVFFLTFPFPSSLYLNFDSKGFLCLLCQERYVWQWKRGKGKKNKVFSGYFSKTSTHRVIKKTHGLNIHFYETKRVTFFFPFTTPFQGLEKEFLRLGRGRTLKLKGKRVWVGGQPRKGTGVFLLPRWNFGKATQSQIHLEIWENKR